MLSFHFLFAKDGVFMYSENIKQWSILIYGNGNNELEPEIINSKKIVETIGSNENVNVLMQIARESKNLVRILRPFDDIPSSDDDWTGTRRYFIQKNNSKLISKLGSINMADAKNLYNFIIWAAQNYPAHHYMLILGGHAYQFVGCMTDYSCRLPYIMGFPEMNKAIDLACEYMNINIDYLFLDTCYSNFIEVVYEFGKNENTSVNYLITYLLNGPLTGFPLDKIINIIIENYKIENKKDLLNLLVYNIVYDVVAFKIDYYILHSIKNLFNDLAIVYNELNDKDKIALPLLFNNNDNTKPYYKLIETIKIKMNSLICDYKKSPHNHFSLINIANKPAKDIEVIKLYSKLAFAKNNNWVNLLYDIDIKVLKQNSTILDLHPVTLTLKAVYAYIIVMNKSQDTNIKNKILNNLIKYKGWKIKKLTII